MSYNLGDIQFGAQSMTSLDRHITQRKLKKVAGRIKTGSVEELTKLGFQRLAGEYLINVAKGDLWTLEADGTIARYFNEDEIVKE